MWVVLESASPWLHQDQLGQLLPLGQALPVVTHIQIKLFKRGATPNVDWKYLVVYHYEHTRCPISPCSPMFPACPMSPWYRCKHDCDPKSHAVFDINTVHGYHTSPSLLTLQEDLAPQPFLEDPSVALMIEKIHFKGWVCNDAGFNISVHLICEQSFSPFDRFLPAVPPFPVARAVPKYNNTFIFFISFKRLKIKWKKTPQMSG